MSTSNRQEIIVWLLLWRLDRCTYEDHGEVPFLYVASVLYNATENDKISLDPR